MKYLLLAWILPCVGENFGVNCLLWFKKVPGSYARHLLWLNSETGWFLSSEFGVLKCVFRCNWVKISLLGILPSPDIGFPCLFLLLDLAILFWNWCAELFIFLSTFGLDKFSNSDLVIDTLTVYEKKNQNRFLWNNCHKKRLRASWIWRILQIRDVHGTCDVANVLRRIAETVWRAENSDQKHSRKVWLKQYSDFVSLKQFYEFA